MTPFLIVNGISDSKAQIAPKTSASFLHCVTCLAVGSRTTFETERDFVLFDVEGPRLWFKVARIGHRTRRNDILNGSFTTSSNSVVVRSTYGTFDRSGRVVSCCGRHLVSPRQPEGGQECRHWCGSCLLLSRSRELRRSSTGSKLSRTGKWSSSSTIRSSRARFSRRRSVSFQHLRSDAVGCIGCHQQRFCAQ